MNVGKLYTLAELDEKFGQIRKGDPFIFTELFDELARVDLAAATLEKPLAGVCISIKDMIDVAGYRSRAGSIAHKDCEVAAEDAPAVSALRKAGAILLGHTNMTELAYSGLGLNPHHGTPCNALWPDAVPGGSTSGGAVSVALGLADIALGTDTGGSLRIPAAFNGIVGFKPTQSTVSLQGCVSLSSSLDSVGPICRSVKEVVVAWNVIRNPRTSSQLLPGNCKILIAENFGFDGIEEPVAEAFIAACSALQRQGIRIEKCDLPLLDGYADLPVWQFAAVEGYCTHRRAIEEDGHRLDPRVMSRLALGSDVRAVDYLETCRRREAFVARFRDELQGTVLLMPTVAIAPPKLDAVQSDDAYFSKNRMVLRNTTLANVADGCSISIPFTHRNHTIGLMLTAPSAHDDALLSLAATVEEAVSGARPS
jgi:aspartyl-tRNA(Asn)/glutamyl-tRNA(Gln) amidotransferase subunit A